VEVVVVASVLPPNASLLERATESAVNAAISSISVPVKDLWSPELCPVELLPWLAWALSVDNWNANWSEAVQRSVIKASVGVHRHKGTIGALRRAIAALGHGIEVQEWFQYGGAPYSFRLNVNLTARGLTDLEQQEILLTVEQTKNVRSWLEALIVYLTSRASVYCAATIQSGEDCTIYPYALSDLDQRFVPVLAIGVYGVETTTVYPLGV